MKKIIAVFGVLSLLTLMLAACGNRANRPEQRIAGRWESNAGATEFQFMEFIPNSENPQRGQVNLRLLSNEISGEYEITTGDEQHRLTITYTLMMFPTTREFYFTVEDDTLVLQKGRTRVTYRRVAE